MYICRVELDLPRLDTQTDRDAMSCGEGIRMIYRYRYAGFVPPRWHEPGPQYWTNSPSGSPQLDPMNNCSAVGSKRTHPAYSPDNGQPSPGGGG